MKKILLASSALIVTAGYAAAADVKIGGDARMGVVYWEDKYQNNLDTTESSDDYQFHSRLRIKFTLSGETDSGLAFGGEVRADNATGGAGKGGDGSQMTDGNIYVSSEFGKLAMGDVSGGMEMVVGDFVEIGYSSFGGATYNENIFFFNGGKSSNGYNDRPSAVYSYTFSDVTIGVGIDDDSQYSIGLGYNNGMIKAGVGYEQIPSGKPLSFSLDDKSVSLTDGSGAYGDTKHWGGMLGATFAGVTVTGIYTKAENDITSGEQYGVGASYKMDAWTFAGYWKHLKSDAETSSGIKLDGDIWAVGGFYDLGGGATLGAGYMNVDGTNVADFGIKFKF